METTNNVSLIDTRLNNAMDALDVVDIKFLPSPENNTITPNALECGEHAAKMLENRKRHLDGDLTVKVKELCFD